MIPVDIELKCDHCGSNINFRTVITDEYEDVQHEMESLIEYTEILSEDVRKNKIELIN
jgi:hypothetical protein